VADFYRQTEEPGRDRSLRASEGFSVTLPL